MWDRIFLLVLAICSAIMAGLTYYAWSWLQSIGAPQATVDGYTFHSGLAFKFVWISSIVMLVLANFLLARFRRSWAMWATFVYFAAFIATSFFFLESSFLKYKVSTGLAQPGLPVASLVGALIIIAAGVIVFVDQLAIVRLRERIYPTVVESSADNDLPVEEASDETS